MSIVLARAAAVAVLIRPVKRPDYKNIKRVLFDQDLRLTDLAQRIGTPVTTLGSWLRGAHPPPADLSERLEKALGLAPGAL